MSTLPGILINKYIKQVLSDDEILTEMVKADQIKVMLTNPVKFPFVSLKRSAIDTTYNKDRSTEDVVTVEIAVVSDNYTQCIEIAQRIREILDYKVYRNTEDNIFITYIRLTDVQEDTVNDAYIQNLNFQMHCQNIHE